MVWKRFVTAACVARELDIVVYFAHVIKVGAEIWRNGRESY